MSGTGNRGNNGHAYHFAQKFVVDSVARFLEFVVHVEGYHHLAVHVDQLGCEVKVAFEIGRHNHIYDHIGSFVLEITAYIEFLGGV